MFSKSVGGISPTLLKPQNHEFTFLFQIEKRGDNIHFIKLLQVLLPDTKGILYLFKF